jgi:hypothetical protein
LANLLQLNRKEILKQKNFLFALNQIENYLSKGKDVVSCLQKMPKTRIKKPVVISLRCSPEIKDFFDTMCEARGMTSSAVFEKLVLNQGLELLREIHFWNEAGRNGEK